MCELSERHVFDGVRVPLLIEPSTANRDLAALLAENEQAIHAALLERGAIVFRGFGTDSLASFEHAVAARSADRMDYRYGSTPAHTRATGPHDRRPFKGRREVVAALMEPYRGAEGTA